MELSNMLKLIMIVLLHQSKVKTLIKFEQGLYLYCKIMRRSCFSMLHLTYFLKLNVVGVFCDVVSNGLISNQPNSIFLQ